MVLYVKAKEIDFGDIVWLKLEGSNVEVFDKVEPDPFSRVANIVKDRIIEVGIFKYKVVGDTAYTRAFKALRFY